MTNVFQVEEKDDYIVLSEPNWCQLFARERLRYNSLRRYSILATVFLALNTIAIVVLLVTR